tara:strand:+ start:2764 stop:3594 length:831 start_codon:yes stop_codon:yes gene_type:complete
MQLKRKEVNKINLNSNELSFSKEIAETLGIESAIILNLYKENKLDDVSSTQGIFESVRKNISFIDDQTINSCITKLIKFNLLKIESTKINNNYNLVNPSKNHSSKRLDNNWHPAKETFEILKMTDIPDNFCELKLKEFKIYWIERGQKKNNWNSTFIDFLRREWTKEINSEKKLPHTIDENWYPDEDVFDILNLSEIDKESALKYLREFILYWKDKGEALTTWNSKFIDHVKRRQLMSDNIENNEGNKGYSEPGKFTKDFKTRKDDSDWAKEINLD